MEKEEIMKKVFIVEECWEYEGSILLGTFDNEKAAQEYVDILEREWEEDDKFRNSYYYITESSLHSTVESLLSQLEEDDIKFSQELSKIWGC